MTAHNPRNPYTKKEGPFYFFLHRDQRDDQHLTFLDEDLNVLFSVATRDISRRMSRGDLLPIPGLPNGAVVRNIRLDRALNKTTLTVDTDQGDFKYNERRLGL